MRPCHTSSATAKGSHPNQTACVGAPARNHHDSAVEIFKVCGLMGMCAKYVRRADDSGVSCSRRALDYATEPTIFRPVPVPVPRPGHTFSPGAEYAASRRPKPPCITKTRYHRLKDLKLFSGPWPSLVPMDANVRHHGFSLYSPCCLTLKLSSPTPVIRNTLYPLAPGTTQALLRLCSGNDQRNRQTWFRRIGSTLRFK